MFGERVIKYDFIKQILSNFEKKMKWGDEVDLDLIFCCCENDLTE